MKCDAIISAYLATLEQGFSCFESDGRIGLVTPYLYPDHDHIEIFVRQHIGGDAVVSDLGETTRRLASLGVDLYQQGDRKFLAERLASGLGVLIANGVLLKRGSSTDVGSLIFDVLAASKAVSDLAYSTRTYRPAEFEDEVAEFFKSSGVIINRNVEVTGGSGTRYKIPFEVPATRGPAVLIQTIPLGAGRTRHAVDRTFRMWADVEGDVRRITLVNDESRRLPQSDQNILARFSDVVGWTAREDWVKSLKKVA